MPTKRYACIGITPTSSQTILKLKEGLFRDFKGAWLSRESIDMITAMEGYDVWNGFTWQESNIDRPEDEYETALKMLRERPE